MTHYRLLTPGPTMVPPQTLAAMGEPVIHHRTAEFRKVLAELQEGLRYVFRTNQPVYTIVGSGTAAFEAGLTSVVAAGRRVLNVSSGRFAERWGAMARSFGMEVTDAPFEYGTHVAPDAMGDLLREKAYDAVVITHSETSTGTACDLEGVARAVRERLPDAIIVVDGITSVGAIPFDMDAWEIDVAVTGSQKALMCPPGLGYVALSKRAWRAAEAFEQKSSYYLDLRKYRKAMADGDAPFTLAVPLVKGQNVSLKLLREEGLENIWRRTRAHAEATRRGMTAIGFDLFSKMPADSVSAFRYPDGVDDSIRKQLHQRHGVHVAGGQGPMTGKIFRVNHMGYTDLYDALACVAASEHVLRGMGRPLTIGAGVSSAQEAMGEFFGR